jgi:sporulation protein YlmC with PRC-barrel domain
VHKEAPPQPETAPSVVETPTNAVVDAQVKPMPVSVTSILGKKVQGPKGEDLGRVVDVLADDTGRVRIAIIDFGGFLGVGNRRIAVDWPLLRFNPDARESSLLLSVTRDKLKSAPEYKDNPRPQVLMVP